MAIRDTRYRNLRTGAVLGLVAVGMVGLSFAAVPLYQLFCQVTGFAGTPQIAEAAPEKAIDRRFTIRFNANVNPDLDWSFRPAQQTMDVAAGEQALAFYVARNTGSRPVVGTATFNVTPEQAGGYFAKVACFCFTEQVLAPGERIDMPVSFYVDPDVVNEKSMDGVTSITLSYTFFPAEDQSAARPRTQARAVTDEGGPNSRRGAGARDEVSLDRRVN